MKLIKTYSSSRGGVRCIDTKYYRTWGTLEKWWNKRLERAKRVNPRYAGANKGYSLGVEASLNGVAIASYLPWKNLDIQLTKPKQGDVSVALSKLDKIASSLADKAVAKEIFEAVAEIRKIIA